MSYIVESTNNFFEKLDKMQNDLAKFSQNLDNRSSKIPVLLENFERAVFDPKNEIKSTGGNEVEKAVQKSLEKLKAVVETWREKIEADRKGKEFIRKNEKYLVVMIFGAVKAGKSTLGNFFAGKKFVNAPFDNPYKKIPKPKFEIEEGGRESGGIEKDESGDQWFAEGYIDTTGAIQYFTLSGLRWIDSPGTGAVKKSGDKKDMTKLVEEYISYTDMCIFLMNSSEPGLQDDMRYMQKLSREGQEALIVITKSDFRDEDFIDGKLISVLSPKSVADRKLQEDDICKRVKENYPDIDENKFRAISISTALAGEAIENEDDEKFRESHLDLLMKILGDKVSDNAIERKQKNPRRLLNNFVDEVVERLKDFDNDLNSMTDAIEKYKSEMEKISALIVTNVKREVRAEVDQTAYDWNSKVKRGGKIGNENINMSVAEILKRKLNEEINSQMKRIIEDYESQELPTVKANLESPELRKRTAKIAHTYTESYTVERDTHGLVELVGKNIFGKEYYRTVSETKTEFQTVDAGTNLDDFLNDLMPQVEKFAQNEANNQLVKLRDTYFAMREEFVKKMRSEIEKLKTELNALKF